MSCDNVQLNDFYKRDTVPFTVIIKQNGTPVDITGSTLTITLKKKPTDDDPGALQKDAVLTDPTNGTALFTLSSSDTDIDAMSYYYDIQWKDVANNITTILSGSVEVLQDITES